MTRQRAMRAAATLSLAFGVGCTSALAADAVPGYIKNVLGEPGRPPWDVGRDPLRKPDQVLAFAKVKPGQVIVDLVPGDGYYTRMLAKIAGAKGKVYAYVPQGALGGPRDGRVAQREGKAPTFNPEDKGAACTIGCYDGEVAAHGIVPNSPLPRILEVDYVLAIQNVTEYGKNMTVLWEGFGGNGTSGGFGLPAQADVVFSAEGYHKLHYAGPARGNSPPRSTDLTNANKAVYRAMNPGGYYVIADYSAAPGVDFSSAESLNRVDPEAVKAEVIPAGFVFDGESKILANASDDHKWKVEGKYDQRDKADQFVLRFKKPENASPATKRPSAAEEAKIMKSYYGNTFIGRADLTKLNTKTGARTRFHYYNPDHTYQEFGRLGEGPGPMQAGDWFWSADGLNCQLHEFPLDERGNVVCHVDVEPDAKAPFDVISDGLYGGPAKVTMKHGHIMQFPVKTQD